MSVLKKICDNKTLEVNDLKKKIAFYTENPNIRKTISEEGRIHVQKYSRDNWAKRLIDCSLSLS